MHNQKLQLLVEKYLSGNCSAEERELLEQWYLDWQPDNPVVGEQLFIEAKSEIFARLPLPAKSVKKAGTSLRKLLAAAAVFLIIAAGLFFISRSDQHSAIEIVQGSVDPPAGTNGAKLTFTDGREITLSGAQRGIKLSAGGIAYLDGSALTDSSKIFSETARNTQLVTASTAIGQTYQVTLPDGTVVWLNSASALSFPVSFDPKKSRIVRLSGEGYFEVNKRTTQAFIVHAGNQAVEVLGTQFNINSYENEVAVKTTLLKGSVRVSYTGLSKNKQVMLRPGEQAYSNTHEMLVKAVDAEKTIDWQRGDFEFEAEPIASIMRKIARWYGVEVRYQEGVDQNETFSGTVIRQKHLSEVLEIMQTTGRLRFKIEGRQVTVMK